MYHCIRMLTAHLDGCAGSPHGHEAEAVGRRKALGKHRLGAVEDLRSRPVVVLQVKGACTCATEQRSLLAKN